MRKKIIKFALNPIFITMLIFCGLIVHAGWGKKPFYGFEFLSVLGPFAGSASLLLGEALLVGGFFAVIWVLLCYGEWYNKKFNNRD